MAALDYLLTPGKKPECSVFPLVLDHHGGARRSNAHGLNNQKRIFYLIHVLPFLVLILGCRSFREGVGWQWHKPLSVHRCRVGCVFPLLDQSSQFYS